MPEENKSVEILNVSERQSAKEKRSNLAKWTSGAIEGVTGTIAASFAKGRNDVKTWFRELGEMGEGKILGQAQ